jgi:transporter family protein
MGFDWVIVSLVVAVLFALANVLDKLVISKEMRDPVLATVIVGFVSIIIYGGVSLFVSGIEGIWIGFVFASIMFVAGLLSGFGVYFYYSAIKKSDVSRIITIMALHPLIVLVLAGVILGESLEVLNYLGILLIVLGAGLISFNKINLSKREKVVASVLAVASVVFFGLRDILSKYVTSSIDVWPLLFWVGLGVFVFGLFLLGFGFTGFKGKSRKGIRNLVLIDTLSVSARILLIVAISLGPVSLVVSMANVKPLIVLGLTLILGKFYPKILNEKLSFEGKMRRIFAAVLVVLGAFLIA